MRNPYVGVDVDEPFVIPEHWKDFPNVTREVVINVLEVSAIRNKDAIAEAIVQVLGGKTVREASVATKVTMQKTATYLNVAYESLKQVMGESMAALSPDKLQELAEDELKKEKRPAVLAHETEEQPIAIPKQPSRRRTTYSEQTLLDITAEVTEWLAQHGVDVSTSDESRSQSNGAQVQAPSGAAQSRVKKRAWQESSSLLSGDGASDTDVSTASPPRKVAGTGVAPEDDGVSFKIAKYLEKNNVPQAERLTAAIRSILEPLYRVSMENGVSSVDLIKQLHHMAHLEFAEHGCEQSADMPESNDVPKAEKDVYSLEDLKPLEELAKQMHTGPSKAEKMEAIIEYTVRCRSMPVESQKDLMDALTMHMIVGTGAQSVMELYSSIEAAILEDCVTLAKNVFKLVTKDFPVVLVRCKSLAADKEKLQPNNLNELIDKELAKNYINLLRDLDFPLTRAFTTALSGIVVETIRRDSAPDVIQIDD
ncbi:hypothetical protein AAVH_18712 [Aphelenchoides avenae]|nr:hypothetical protein AAVH_18712 [Aphelenchus avenae]